MLTQPTPALVTQRAAARLPRWALLLLCAAYLLPGLLGRDPWRNADLTAYGYMLGLAEGRMSWWGPSLGGLPAETALLPHWLGAWCIQGLGSWMDPALAARLPFAGLLALTLALIWYSAYHLARSDAAQPLPFAFGGEAEPAAYARALADGAMLAAIASLGLLQLGHETTPELVQLALLSTFMWAYAAAPVRRWACRSAVLVVLPLLALSGAPTIALVLGGLGLLLGSRSSHTQVRSLWPWLLAGLALAAGLASEIGAWQWRVSLRSNWQDWAGIARLLLWFTWPTLPMAGWTLWRWRSHWASRHIALPLTLAAVNVACAILMNGSDRALLRALPSLAILAAFALPTLSRTASAAVDWFSVFFFSTSALTLWVIYSSMQTGLPAQPAINIVRLAPGFQPSFSSLAVFFGLCGSAAWVALVRWRTARHRDPVWKSLVLPASGVALAWLLTMTLMLPVIDYARSTRPLVRQVLREVPATACISAPGLSRTHIAGLEVFGHYTVNARDAAEASGCPYLLTLSRAANSPTPPGWQLLTRIRRPVDRAEHLSLYRKLAAPATP
jgi:hypothetical protein